MAKGICKRAPILIKGLLRDPRMGNQQNILLKPYSLFFNSQGYLQASLLDPWPLKKGSIEPFNKIFCGERGIRTPGGLTLNGFQDHRIRPLCHLS